MKNPSGPMGRRVRSTATNELLLVHDDCLMSGREASITTYRYASRHRLFRCPPRRGRPETITPAVGPRAEQTNLHLHDRNSAGRRTHHGVRHEIPESNGFRVRLVWSVVAAPARHGTESGSATIAPRRIDGPRVAHGERDDGAVAGVGSSVPTPRAKNHCKTNRHEKKSQSCSS